MVKLIIFDLDGVLKVYLSSYLMHSMKHLIYYEHIQLTGTGDL